MLTIYYNQIQLLLLSTEMYILIFLSQNIKITAVHTSSWFIYQTFARGLCIFSKLPINNYHPATMVMQHIS